MSSTVYFTSAKVERIDPNASLPAKFERLLDRTPLKDVVKGKTVAVKMHLGNRIGYTTIHPLFVKILINAIKKSGGQPFITDTAGAIAAAADRGYTAEILGAPIVSATGMKDKYYYKKRVEYKTLEEVEIAGEIHDADAMIDFSHVKGHGACGYGGACKNIAMGCVSGRTRSGLHRLEGGIIWDKTSCSGCELCIEACRYDANKFTEQGNFEIFYHHCTFCQHCVNACPNSALQVDVDSFRSFQTGMALATKAVLDTFEPGNVFYINILTNITMLCDCWGFSMPSIVPDIGIAASGDIVAIEQASLDLIKVENFIEGSLPEGRTLGEGKHLLEMIHHKDPFIQLEELEKLGLGTRSYRFDHE